MKQLREVFTIELVAKVASINLDDIKVTKMDCVTMSNEDDEVLEFKGRVWDYSKERCSDGVKIKLHVVNDGKDLMERMDWLHGEEYVVSGVDMEVMKESSGTVLEYELVSPYGTQNKIEIDIVENPALEKAFNYAVDRLTEGNIQLKSVILDVLRDDETGEYMIDLLNKIVDIPIL